MRRKQTVRKQTHSVLIVLLSFLLIAILLFSLLQLVRGSVRPQQMEQPVVSKTVTYDGVEYFPRQDMDIVLVMGIDKFGPVEPSISYNNDGEADVVMLLIFDHAECCIRVLNIDRDTMTNMPILGIGGKQAGSAYGQLALAQTYGSGLEDSCENTRDTVSTLLNGVNIDHYIAMRMDAIAIVNDAVGGVRVFVDEDMSITGSNIPMGETVLHGQQAIDFVRFRKGVGDQLNASRMERQQAFLEGFFAALHEARENSADIVAKTYDEISDYIVTDCSSTVLSSMLDRYGDYTFADVREIPGESRKGEKHMGFYPDEEALDRLVLELFYAPK